MKIAIEGMDGVGKTTIAMALAKYLGYEYVSKPFKFIFDNLNISESQIKEIEWKLYETQDEVLLSMFYGLGLVFGSRCKENMNIVYDRHFVSNYYWHGNKETENIHTELLKLCGHPDLTILLTASVETRMHRIYKRDKNDSDLTNCAMYEDGSLKMEEYLLANNFNYMSINTEKLTPDDILEIIIKKIKDSNEKRYVKERN